MIEVKHLDKYFDNGTRQVLYDINATFYDGKVNLIIGQSGSGKTVLVKTWWACSSPSTARFSTTAATSPR